MQVTRDRIALSTLAAVVLFAVLSLFYHDALTVFDKLITAFTFILGYYFSDPRLRRSSGT